MTEPMLAAILDGRVVMLDIRQARVLLLDPRTERIWRTCTGLTSDEIAGIVREAPADVTHTLSELAAAGLISFDRDRWNQAYVTWI